MSWHFMRRAALACAPGVACALGVACGSGDPNGPARQATKLVLVTAPSATAETMTPLPVQPVVQVADANGQPVSKPVNVIASVATGNGTVMSGGTVATDANGRAAFTSLTVGAASGAVGPITLQFGAAALTPATADVELRCAVRPIAMGQTITSALVIGDCASTRGALIRNYALTTAQPLTAVVLRIDQTGMSNPFLGVKGPDDPHTFWGWSAPGWPVITFKALLAAGANQVEVSDFTVGEGGSYKLAVGPTTEDLTCDYPDAWASGTVTTSQDLGAEDCADFTGEGVEDYLLVGLSAGETVTATMTATAFQPRVSLLDATTGDTVAAATASGNASLTFMNGSTALPYYLVLASAPAGGEGAYTLSIAVSLPLSGTAPAITRAAPIVRRGRAPRPGRAVPVWVGSEIRGR